MAKVFIEETTLTAIGDAIREKTGGTDLIAPGDMPTQISGIVAGGGDGECSGLHIPEENLRVTGRCDYRFAYNGWNWFIEECGDKITTDSISNATNMFAECTNLTEIPFSINFCDTSTAAQNTNQMFMNCRKLVKVPEMKGLYPYSLMQTFMHCEKLKEFPKDFAKDWDWSTFQKLGQYVGQMNGIFNNCYSLREVPQYLYIQENVDRQINYSYSCYSSAFNSCYSLERVCNFPVYTKATFTSNAFSTSFNYCARLKEFTFLVQADGTPYTANWKNQTIDLSTAGYYSHLPQYVPEFTNDTKITTSAQRYAYCNGAIYDDEEPFEKDGWADVVGWSTFGRSAAKKLFATLPDTSAAGGGNTIKFKEQAAIKCGTSANSDAIVTLTEEEIAVATAKGWTISLV